MTQAVLGIAGWKNSGKTTLTTRLVEELVRRGYSVSTVKHAHHEADIDHEGTDSYRHRAAGAREVALVTARRWALMHELRHEPEPEDLGCPAIKAYLDSALSTRGYLRHVWCQTASRAFPARLRSCATRAPILSSPPEELARLQVTKRPRRWLASLTRSCRASAR